MGTRISRREKIDWIRDKLDYTFSKLPDSTIDKNKFLASFALKNASTKRTGQEILDDLENVGMIEQGEEVIKKGGKNEN